MSIFTLTQKLLRRFVLLGLALCLVACASHPTAPAQNAIPMPGDATTYGFGVSQSKEDFANVEIAQLNFGMYKTQRSWQRILPNKGSARYLGLRAYYPVDVRWKLKDGREFILEGIDTESVMRAYFQTNQLQLIHQREKRLRHPVGDYDPALQVGVKNDTVVIKWLLILNHTPPSQRLQASGAVNPWNTEYEEHFVTAIKGQPTSGIDFSKTFEARK